VTPDRLSEGGSSAEGGEEVKTVLYLAAGGLLLLTAGAQAQLQGIDPRTGQVPEPVIQPVVKPVPRPALKEECKTGECTGDYGTSISFEENPKDAAARALKEEKLVLVLHVSGNFENPDFT
jgi:hypothetical protein